MPDGDGGNSERQERQRRKRQARLVVGGEPPGIEYRQPLVEQRIEHVSEYRMARRLAKLGRQVVKSHRADQLVVDIDAVAVDVGEIVELIPDDLLRVDRD